MNNEECNEKQHRNSHGPDCVDGINAGIKRGIMGATKQIAVNMLKENMPIDLICRLTCMTAGAIKDLKDNDMNIVITYLYDRADMDRMYNDGVTNALNQVSVNLLAEKQDVGLVSRVTGFSEEQIERFKTYINKRNKQHGQRKNTTDI